MSDALIQRLAADLRPASRFAVARRLAVGAGAGAVASAVLAWLVLGPRPDIASAVVEGMFWVKLAYVLVIVALALRVCDRLARPVGDPRRRLVWIAVPVLLVAVIAAGRLIEAPAPMRGALLMGRSAQVCPWRILALSLPPLAGLVWALRGLAPTRLRLAGFGAGLAAGGLGAAAYALHCPEPTLPFLATWYTFGIGAAGGLGAAAGPRVLRW